jgi:hypothetical protein
MLQCEITAEGVTSQIDDLLSKQKIKLSMLNRNLDRG